MCPWLKVPSKSQFCHFQGVCVVSYLQRADFPASDLSDDGIVFGLQETLNGHDSAGVTVDAAEDIAI